jgi:hypothetical protein
MKAGSLLLGILIMAAFSAADDRCQAATFPKFVAYTSNSNGRAMDYSSTLAFDQLAIGGQLTDVQAV